MAIRRGTRLYIWIDDKKKELIQRRAIDAGMTISEFVISASINSSIHQKISLFDRKLLTEIAIELKELMAAGRTGKETSNEIEQLLFKISKIL